MDKLFCAKCDNMLVTCIQVREEDEKGPAGVSVDSDDESGDDREETRLVNFCRQCNYSVENTDTTKSVYHNNYNMDNIKRTHLVNKFTAYDTTLPRALGIKCPNDSCPAKKADIRYIKYDEDNMKYIYICLNCHSEKIEPHIW
jgi:hypothetical protein|tara:strand:- start:241 stop:669 length:429 start_codon:yes stop_codon:yes gene_type:complete